MIKTMIKVLVNGQFRWVKETTISHTTPKASASEVRSISPKTGILIAK